MSAKLELLSPARTADIGIAAIDCGADAVYMAGPAFGARAAAGNSIEDISRLCSYAHLFSAKVHATVNTILFESQLPEARRLLESLASAGVDAFIVQDMALPELTKGLGVPLHASTQCSIRTPQRALFLYKAGFRRIILERQLTLEEIRAIREALPDDCEIEFFVHGALCVCYSGQCYLSSYLTGRSANRGVCAQACRSIYSIEDEHHRRLASPAAFLSLKDYRLIDRMKELADAGVTSFKIEGRLKNESYVRNVTAAYSSKLDEIVSGSAGQYERSSFGRNYSPAAFDLSRTFNRDYTSFLLDGTRSRGLSCADAPKSMGERIGVIKGISANGKQLEVCLDSRDTVLSNGDGFAVVDGSEIRGFRADIARGNVIITSTPVPDSCKGKPIFRNFDSLFEKAVAASSRFHRQLLVSLYISVEGKTLCCRALCEDGRSVSAALEFDEFSRNPQKQKTAISDALSKTAEHYCFKIEDASFPLDSTPFLRPSQLNSLRMEIASMLDKASGESVLQTPSKETSDGSVAAVPTASAFAEGFDTSYKANVSNSLARDFYSRFTDKPIEDAYELSCTKDAELMRSRFCLRFEMGLCPYKRHCVPPVVVKNEPASLPDARLLSNAPSLFLSNNSRRLRLEFDCAHCEMIVRSMED